MKHHHYDVVRKERRDISEGVLPIDLMAELYNTKAEDEMLVFSLTGRALCITCEVECIFFPFPFMWHGIDVQWGEKNKWCLELNTWDNCESFFLETANTENFVYERPEEGAKVIHYVIG